MADFNLNAGIALANALGINTGLDQSVVDSISQADESELNKQRGYQLGADRARGNNPNDDFFNLSQDAYIAKYGERNYYDTLQGYQQFTADNSVERTGEALAMDAIAEAGRGAITPLVQIPAAIANAVSPELGSGLSKAADSLNEGFDSLRSYNSQFQKRAYEAKTASNETESERQYQRDLASGMSVPEAEAKKTLRDTGNTLGTLAGDSARVFDIAANGVGSLVSSAAISQTANLGMRGAAAAIADRAAKNKITKAKLSGLGRDAIKDALNYRQRARVGMAQFADNNSWALSIGAMEGASGSADTMNEVMGMSTQDLYTRSPDFSQRVSENLNKGMSLSLAEKQAKLDIASSAATNAGILQGALGVASGRLSKGLEKNIINPLSAKPRASAIADMAKETLEEAIQGGGGQAIQNAMIKAYADNERRISEGIGQNLAESAVGGLTSAGIVQTPSQLSRAVGDASRSVYEASKVPAYYAGKGAGYTYAKGKDTYNKAKDTIKDFIDSNSGSELTRKAKVAMASSPAVSDTVSVAKDIVQNQVPKATSAASRAVSKAKEIYDNTVDSGVTSDKNFNSSLDKASSGSISISDIKKQSSSLNTEEQTKVNEITDSLLEANKPHIQSFRNIAPDHAILNKAIDKVENGTWSTKSLKGFVNRLGYKGELTPEQVNAFNKSINNFNKVSSDNLKQIIKDRGKNIPTAKPVDTSTQQPIDIPTQQSTETPKVDTTIEPGNNTNTSGSENGINLSGLKDKAGKAFNKVSESLSDLAKKASDKAKNWKESQEAKAKIKAKAKELFTKLADKNQDINDNDYQILSELIDNGEDVGLTDAQKRLLKKSWMITNRLKNYREKFNSEASQETHDTSSNTVDAKANDAVHKSPLHRSIREHIAEIAQAVLESDGDPKANARALKALERMHNAVYTSSEKMRAWKASKETGEPQTWNVRGPKWESTWKQKTAEELYKDSGSATHVTYNESPGTQALIRQTELDHLALVTAYNELADLLGKPKEATVPFLLDHDSYVQEGNKIVQGFKDVKPVAKQETQKKNSSPSKQINTNPTPAEGPTSEDSQKAQRKALEAKQPKAKENIQTGEIEVTTPAVQEPIAPSTAEADMRESLVLTPPTEDVTSSGSDTEITEAQEGTKNAQEEAPETSMMQTLEASLKASEEASIEESDSSESLEESSEMSDAPSEDVPINNAPSQNNTNTYNNVDKKITDSKEYPSKFNGICEAITDTVLLAQQKQETEEAKALLEKYKALTNKDDGRDDTFYFYKDSQKCLLKDILANSFKSNPLNGKSNVAGLERPIDILDFLYQDNMDMLNRLLCEDSKSVSRELVKDRKYREAVSKELAGMFQTIKEELGEEINRAGEEVGAKLEQLVNGEKSEFINRALGLAFVEKITEKTPLRDTQGKLHYRYKFKLQDRITDTLVLATMSYLIQMNGRGNSLDEQSIAAIFGDGTTTLTTEQIQYAMAINPDFMANDLTKKFKDYLGITYNDEASIQETEGILKAAAVNIMAALCNGPKMGKTEYEEKKEEAKKNNSLVPVSMTQSRFAVRIYADGETTHTRKISPQESHFTARIFLKKLFNPKQNRNHRYFIENPNILDDLCLKTNSSFVQLDVNKLVIPRSIRHTPEGIVRQTKVEYQANVNKSRIPYLLDRTACSVFKGLGADGLSNFLGTSIQGADNSYNINDLESIKSRKTVIEQALEYLDTSVFAINAKNAESETPSSVWETPQYFISQAISTGRSMMLNPCNPVGNKVLREMCLGTWSNLDLVNNDKHQIVFKLAIAQAFGEKIQYDLPSSPTSCPPKTAKLFEKLVDPNGVFKTKIFPLLDKIAVSNTTDFSDIKPDAFASVGKELRSLVQNELSEEIYGAKGKIDTSMLSLKAMLEVKRYLSEDTDKSNFRTSLYIEPDGITNGSAMAQLLSYCGVITPEYIALLARCGISCKEGFIATAAQLKDLGEKSNLPGSINYANDIYTTNAINANQAVANFKESIEKDTSYEDKKFAKFKPEVQELTDACEKLFAKFASGVSITTDADGVHIEYQRSAVKKPGQTLGYGIGNRSTSANLFHEAEKGIYAHLSKVIKQVDIIAEEQGIQDWKELSTEEKQGVINNAFNRVDPDLGLEDFVSLLEKVTMTFSKPETMMAPTRAMFLGSVPKNDWERYSQYGVDKYSPYYIKDYDKKVNAISAFDKTLSNIANGKLEALMDFTIPDAIKEISIDNFANTFGGAIYASGRKTLGDSFLSDVQNIVTATSVASIMYAQVYKAELQKLINSKGKNVFDISRKDLKDLNDRLADIRPTYNCAYHNFKGYKTEKFELNNLTYKNLTKRLEPNNPDNKKLIKKSQHTYYMAESAGQQFGVNTDIMVPASCGVSMLPSTNMGAGDAAMMKYLFANNENLRCMDTYDGCQTALDIASDVAYQLNKGILETTTKNNIYKSIIRQIEKIDHSKNSHLIDEYISNCYGHYNAVKGSKEELLELNKALFGSNRIAPEEDFRANYTSLKDSLKWQAASVDARHRAMKPILSVGHMAGLGIDTVATNQANSSVQDSYDPVEVASDLQKRYQQEMEKANLSPNHSLFLKEESVSSGSENTETKPLVIDNGANQVTKDIINDLRNNKNISRENIKLYTRLLRNLRQFSPDLNIIYFDNVDQLNDLVTKNPFRYPSKFVENVKDTFSPTKGYTNAVQVGNDIFIRRPDGDNLRTHIHELMHLQTRMVIDSIYQSPELAQKYKPIIDNIQKLADHFLDTPELLNYAGKNEDEIKMNSYAYSAYKVMQKYKQMSKEAEQNGDTHKANVYRAAYLNEFLAYTSANKELVDKLSKMKPIELANGNSAIRDSLGKFAVSSQDSLFKEFFNKVKLLVHAAMNELRKLFNKPLTDYKDEGSATLFDQYFETLGWAIKANSDINREAYGNGRLTSVFKANERINLEGGTEAETESFNTITESLNNMVQHIENIFASDTRIKPETRTSLNQNYEGIDNAYTSSLLFSGLDGDQAKFVKALAKVLKTPNLLSKKYATQMEQLRKTILDSKEIGQEYKDFLNQNKELGMPLLMGLAQVSPELGKALRDLEVPEKNIYVSNANAKAILDTIAQNAVYRASDASMFSTLNNIQAIIADALYDTYMNDLKHFHLGPFSDTANSINEAISRWMGSSSQWLADRIAQLKVNSDNIFTRNLDRVVSFGNQLINDPEKAKERLLHFSNANRWIPDIVKDAITDIVGLTDTKFNVDDSIKTIKVFVQQVRSNYKNKTINMFNELFEENNLTDNDHKVFFNTLIKSDIGSLTDTTFIELRNYFTGSKDLAQAIKNTEKFISEKNTELFDEQLITKEYLEKEIDKFIKWKYGEKLTDGFLTNAEAIAYKVGSDDFDVIHDSIDDDLIRAIDKLMTLKMIEYSKSKLTAEEKVRLNELFNKNETAMSILFGQCILNHQSVIEGRNKDWTEDDIYGVGTFNYVKGWVPTEYTYDEKIVAVPNSQVAYMENLGYVKVPYKEYGLSQDEMFKANTTYMVADFNDTAIFNEGLLQIANPSLSGCSLSTGAIKGIPGSEYVSIEAYKKNPDAYNLHTDGTKSVRAIYDNTGNVVGLQSIPSLKLTNALNTNINVFNMLGTQAGRQVEEALAIRYNTSSIQKLKEQYENDPNKDDYVDILKSDDPVIKDAVKILPAYLKQMAKEEFPDGKFMIRKDQINDILGMRSFSVGDFWTGNCRYSKRTSEIVSKTAELMLAPFGNGAYKKLILAEQMIQKGVSMARNTIVVKSIVVPFINAVSNIFQLISWGINPVTAFKAVVEKTKELEKYQKTMTELITLQSALEASKRNISMDKDAIIGRLNKLKGEISKLSILPILNAAEFATIADVGDTAFSSKGSILGKRFDEAVDKVVEKLPKSAVAIGKEALFTQDSAIYSYLEKGVKYGDFLAKSILYDHLLNQGMKQEEALRIIKEEFVDYDRSPGRSRQYLENMGLLWFYNFKLRSVKAAGRMIRRNPLFGLIAMSLPTSTPIGNIGLPAYDNLLTKGVLGQLAYSMGPMLGFHAPFKLPALAIFG